MTGSSTSGIELSSSTAERPTRDKIRSKFDFGLSGGLDVAGGDWADTKNT